MVAEKLPNDDTWLEVCIISDLRELCYGKQSFVRLKRPRIKDFNTYVSSIACYGIAHVAPIARGFEFAHLLLDKGMQDSISNDDFTLKLPQFTNDLGVLTPQISNSRVSGLVCRIVVCIVHFGTNVVSQRVEGS